jgi:hypothetical protein
MSDVPPPTNAFEKMMAAARTPAAVVAEKGDDEPVRTAVLYEARLEHADESEPLWRVPYFGQAVRVGTAEEIFAARKREHERDAAREAKDLGLHAVIDRFGPDAIAWRIVSSATGPRTAMQELANAEEIRLIDAHGGVMRDMDTKLTQTLNLTKGGQPGDARAVWEAIDAWRKRAYTKFKAAMAKYVEEYESALVPQTYVNDDGYPLGAQLRHFRQGNMWKGSPWESEATAWARALPKWYWDARESDEWQEELAQRGQERSWKTYVTLKAAMEAYVKEYKSALVPYDYVDVDDDEYPLGVRLSSFRQGRMWKGTPWEDEAKAWAEALPGWHWDARESDEYREGLAQRGQERSRAAYVTFQAAMEKYVEAHASALVSREHVDADGYPLGVRLNGFRKGEMWKDTPWESEAKAWAEALPNWYWNARESDEYREGSARLAKLKETMATDASKAKRRKIATAQRATERRAELERARTVAVPFEKSKARRVEMRAASTDFSGLRGNAVLYMVSEDGKTIRRVQSTGNMGKKHIVGPVVDPPATPEAGPSDLNAYVSDSESESG